MQWLCRHHILAEWASTDCVHRRRWDRGCWTKWCQTGRLHSASLCSARTQQQTIPLTRRLFGYMSLSRTYSAVRIKCTKSVGLTEKSRHFLTLPYCQNARENACVCFVVMFWTVDQSGSTTPVTAAPGVCALVYHTWELRSSRQDDVTRPD